MVSADPIEKQINNAPDKTFDIMKSIKYGHLAVFLLLVILQPAMVPASGQRVTRTFSELYPLTATGSLEVENRYGSVDIMNWDKNEISVEVEVTVAHPDRDLAERQMSYINIEFSRRENDVKAVTVIDQRVREQWLRWFSAGREETRITVNYKIYAPAETSLRITNRYGDIFINEATGHTFIDLMYGNLQANRIIRDNTRPLSEINLAYSTKATVSEADWLQANIRYSDLTVARCQALVVTSSYSKIQVDQASSIVAESRYSEYTLGNINNLVAESSYTNYNINDIGNTLDMKSRYGNLRIANVPAGFSSLKFESSYGNMRASVDPSASYRINASGSYGTVNIPSGNRLERDSRGTSFTLSGVVGETVSPRATVEINTRYGNVDLR
jgi:hypothetical protein